jgi:tetratricopeptide (TPR) repeat protein
LVITAEEIERRLHLLKEKYNAGAISVDQFEAEVEKLHFKDQSGTAWMIGAQSGQWYYHDGQQWVQAEPPRAQAPARSGSEPDAALSAADPSSQAPASTRKSMQWVWFGCAGLAVVILILAIVLIAVVYLTPDNPLEPTPTSMVLLPVPDPPTPTATFAAPVVGDPTPTLALANDSGVLLQEAEDLMLGSRYEEAAARYQKSSELDPSQAVVYARWARALRSQHPPQLEEALGKAIIATELDPASLEGLAELARLNYLLGREDESISAAQQAIKIDPGYVPAHAVLSRIYMNAGRETEGIAEARRAVELDAGSADAHLAMAHSFIFVDQPDAALEEIESAIELEPNVAHHYVELGTQYRRMERFDEAVDAYQAATKLYSDLAPAYDGLGRSYFSGSGDYDKALEAFNRAISLAPQNASAYSGAGYAYLLRGNSEEAQKAFEQALALAPDLQEAKDGLARAEELLAPAPSPSPPSTEESGEVEKPPAVADTSGVEGSEDGGEESTEESPEQPATELSGKIYFPVFHEDQASYDIFWHNADGSGEAQFMLGQASQPAASWDGNSLAFRRWKRDDRGVVAMSISGTDPGTDYHRLTGQSFVEDAMPAWSPDGGSIMFSSRRESDRQSRLYLTPSGGGQERALEQNFKPVIGITPTWLKDGRVVYSGCIGESCGLVVINPDGANPTAITDHWTDFQPSGSPDGSRIAFTSQREGGWEIFTANTDGSDMTRLTDNHAIDGLPIWSPGGNAIAFASDESGLWDIWVMGADGSDRRKLFGVPGSIDGQVAGEDDTKSRGWLEERISWVP